MLHSIKQKFILLKTGHKSVVKNDFKKVSMNISHTQKSRGIRYYSNRNHYWFKKSEYEKIRKRTCLLFTDCSEIRSAVRNVAVAISPVYIGRETPWFQVAVRVTTVVFLVA